MSEPSLADKCAFLSAPEAYANGTTAVTVRETHRSYVFLTDHYAWKLKKPVRETYLDFSTLERRRINCEREVRLNRRLALDVYLGVVPLVVTHEGRLLIGGEGCAVEWLVQMRRLPDGKMLDRAIANRSVSAGDAVQIGRRLTRFYRTATSIPLSPSDYCRRLRDDLTASACELQTFALPQHLIGNVTQAALALIEQYRPVIEARAALVVDAHGDLRPEHVCLEEEPVIIDCLEFCDELRMLDPISELSFFLLECGRLNAAWIGEQVLDVYQQETNIRPPDAVLQLYRLQHALTRAKIAVWHLKDAPSGDWPRWISKATDYLERASRLQ